MLIFIHIPKTAGTSVYNALWRVASDKLAWYSGPETRPQIFFSMPNVRNSIRIYGGHFGYGQIRNFLSADDKVYSVIRDPVERVFSHFNHIAVRDLQHPFHDQIKGRSIIDASRVCPQFARDITNNQCWFLSGSRKFEDACRIINEDDINVYDISQVNRLVEHIARECEIPDTPKVAVDNAGKIGYTSQITKEEKEFVINLNKEDRKLFYHYTTNRAVSSLL